MTDTEKYATANKARSEQIDRILKSTSRHKVVVAGPGTGKTYLFKRVIDGKANTLTLSFVNALVDDLALELCGLSEVRTLHGYARSELRKATKQSVEIHPKLTHVIKEDARILLGRDVDFERVFHTRDDDHQDLPFYSSRRRYYGHFGYSDVIYAAVKYFERNPGRVPSYEQVVVDEFQDFNALEVSLIELLAEGSPILLAGDDDQALYDFKHASAQHIRDRHADGSAYASFNLPFCARCTRVIIDATNDLIAAAQKRGLLAGRIDKPYLYFDDERKDGDSAKYPSLVYRQGYYAQVPWAVEQEVQGFAEDQRVHFTTLVITATSGQCRTVTKALRKKGFENVSYVDREPPEPSLIEGLTLILEDRHSNLGWRIAARALLNNDEFAAALEAADPDKPFDHALDKALVKRVQNLVTKLRHVRGAKIERDQLKELLGELAIDPYEAAEASLREVIETKERVDAAIRKLPIKVTTIQSSKGLAADLVLIAYFDDKYFLKRRDEGPTDNDVCSFLVALTRARKKVVMVSTEKADPLFLGWIDPRRVQRK